MRILQINSVYMKGSTGKIVYDISNEVSTDSDSYVIFGRQSGVPSKNIHFVYNHFSFYYHVFLTRIFDRHGFGSKNITRRVLKLIENINPDIIHIHNLHGYYLNIRILLEYLTLFNKPIVWTLHDSWLYTGHCAYYTMHQCNKWMEMCQKCPARNDYPKSIMFDNSKINFQTKKSLLQNFANITFVTPSNWLKSEVEHSYLKNHEIRVISNGINLTVFKPSEKNFFSDDRYNNKFILLGVSNGWDNRKGLNVFHELSKILDDSFVIFLVGLSKKQIKELPNNIIGVEKTGSAVELAEIYSSADLFVNASVEETFGLVTLESLACGTPVVVFDATAIPEVVTPKTGYVVNKNDINGLRKVILNAREKPLNSSDCIKHAGKYDSKTMSKHYKLLYKELIGVKQ